MKKLAIIGSTGSIGTQTLDVVRRNKKDFSVLTLAAYSDYKTLQNQIEEFSPKAVCLENNAEKLSLGKTELFTGKDCFLEGIVKEADLVVISLVGFNGFKAAYKAVSMGKDIALANKESLVCGGKLITETALKTGAKIYPIDSEHSAIWQALDFDSTKPFKRLIITASGGAFRDKTEEELKSVTAKEALRHPNWNMGDKITVDCATLVNKAFEVIEAHWLFSADYDKIQAVMHRESIVHSLVEFNDNSVIAEMSYPTMEIPIALALDHTKRVVSDVESLDLVKLGTLNFEEIDYKKFPCFNLIVNAGKKGGAYACVASSADEVAVNSFLKGEIGYGDIYKIIDGVVSAYNGNGCDYESVINADAFARKFAEEYIRNIK